MVFIYPRSLEAATGFKSSGLFPRIFTVRCFAHTVMLGYNLKPTLSGSEGREDILCDLCFRHLGLWGYLMPVLSRSLLPSYSCIPR